MSKPRKTNSRICEHDCTVQVSKEDVWVLLMSFVRYSMGRHSYIIGLVQQQLEAYGTYLTAQQWKQIADEIAQYLSMSMHVNIADSVLERETWVHINDYCVKRCLECPDCTADIKAAIFHSVNNAK